MFSKVVATRKLWQIAALSMCLSILQNGGQATAASNGLFEKNSKPQAKEGQNANVSLTVDDVNDVAYALQRIRQQAINIYVEATRKKESPEISAQLPSLSNVPGDLPKEQTNLLPFRRPWLVYFVTTLEPLVHLLKEDVKDIENGSKLQDVPAEKRTMLDPLIKEWSQGVSRIDEQLARATSLIEDADKNNAALARVAYDIDREITKLEQVRDKAFDIVYDVAQSKKAAAK